MQEQTPPGLIAYRRLRWSDFPLRQSGGDPNQVAHTEGRIIFRYTSRWEEVRRGAFRSTLESITFDTYFDTTRSWRRPHLGTDPDRLLAHEQGHLDLTRLATLRLRRLKTGEFGFGVGQSSAVADADLGEQVKRLFQSHLDENQRLQDAYDRETDHGRSASAQARWERKIAQSLAALRES